MIRRFLSLFRRKGDAESDPLIDEALAVADASFDPLWSELKKSLKAIDHDQARFVLRTELVIFFFLFSISFMDVAIRKRRVISIALKRIPQWLVERGFERHAPPQLVDELSHTFSKLASSRLELYRNLNGNKHEGVDLLIRTYIEGFVEIVGQVLSAKIEEPSKQVFIEILAGAMLTRSLIVVARSGARPENPRDGSGVTSAVPGVGEVSVALGHVDRAMAAMGDGVDENQFPGGTGRFGWEPSNPIPCEGLQGAHRYLHKLAEIVGRNVVYKRVGSCSSSVSAYPVDAYVLSGSDGSEVGTVYISQYQKRNSDRLPDGIRGGARKLGSESASIVSSGNSSRPTKARCPSCQQISNIPPGDDELVKCSQCGRLMAV